MRNTKGGKQSIFYYIGKSLLVLLIIGIFLLPSPPSPMASLGRANVAYASAITADKIIALTNQARAKYNLPELTPNPALAKAAEQKAQAIFAAQKFSHNFGDKKFSQWIKEQGYQYAIVGENLAINFTASEPLLNAWLASPTHKKNILHQDYREIGVAVRTADWQGEEETLVVELFGAPPVLAEQLVPDTLEKQNSSPAILNPAQLITSNLAEQYLNNIAPDADYRPASLGKQIELPEALIKNKTALISYLLGAAQMMILYMSLMLLIVLAYGYALYFSRLYKKLRLLAKPQ
ncbi:hypothetical protein A3D54_01805 [Candidatus Falkowbacteria bacterium RIFCSPHIGHO2_02_FULL_45_15]|uniref:SCP domain-containing protein n=1 Tax=Candidatus Falkowbacteria bacterium RIFCSPHIGHO2_02_FULL_45_15 TaxID=1797987 RepID=A0A1F5RYE4_9BACT|nr:MAG: hypothetical protein A3D54_01805 [Candidatus Falkowbacteria bacterium RIFCSPHIGHO2_02_FULL_45_15]